MVVIVMGLPGSGKSYFARRLANVLNAAYLNSDGVRKMMMAKSSYSKDEKSSVYDQVLRTALELLHVQKHIVIDATFCSNALRNKFVDAIKTNIQFIEIRAQESIIKKRLQQKRTDSEADFKVYQIIKAGWELFRSNHLVLHSTNDNIEEMLHKANQYLQQAT